LTDFTPAKGFSPSKIVNRPNVYLFSKLHGHETVEIQRGPPQLKSDEDAYGMRQDFANEAMLEVPQIAPEPHHSVAP